MAAAKLIDSDTLTRLAYVATERGWQAPPDRELAEIDPDAEHPGVVVTIVENGRQVQPADTVSQHAVATVGWLLHLAQDGGAAIVLIDCDVRMLDQLPDIEIPEELGTALMAAARQQLSSIADRANFETQAQEEIRMLLRGER